MSAEPERCSKATLVSMAVIASALMPRDTTEPTLVVRRDPAWWIAAAVAGTCYIVVLGRGIHFPH